MTAHHTPACLLGAMANAVGHAIATARNLLDALDGRVDEDTYDRACRAIAVMELAGESLGQLSDEERDANPEQRCGEPVREAPAGGAN